MLCFTSNAAAIEDIKSKLLVILSFGSSLHIISDIPEGFHSQHTVSTADWIHTDSGFEQRKIRKTKSEIKQGLDLKGPACKWFLQQQCHPALPGFVRMIANAFATLPSGPRCPFGCSGSLLTTRSVDQHVDSLP